MASNRPRRRPRVVDAPQVVESVQSVPESSMAILTNIRELLECPVCFDTMYPPIPQCSNGHSLCSGCKLKVGDECPICRQTFGNMRCITLEKVAATIMLSCKYQPFGCSSIFPHCGKKHESQCSFRPYSCPLPNSKCSNLDDIPSLVNHLKEYHKVLVQDDGSIFNITYVKTSEREVKNCIWKPKVFSCFGQYFYLHFEVFQSGVTPICIAFLQLIGNNEEANSYKYSLEFEGNGRKKICQGAPRSIRDNHSEVRDSFDGLIIQQNLFSIDGNKQKLTVSGRIWKENMLSGGVSGDREQLNIIATESGDREQLNIISTESGDREQLNIIATESGNNWRERLLNFLKYVYYIFEKIKAAFGIFFQPNFWTYEQDLRI